MSDTERDKTAEDRERARDQSGAHAGFGVLTIRDDLVGVIRHPDNAHLDRKPDDEPPEAA